MGFDAFIGNPGAPDQVKCGVFCYGYGRTELAQRRFPTQPRGLMLFFGIGVAFVEVEFFGGEPAFGCGYSSYGIESPECTPAEKKKNWTGPLWKSTPVPLFGSNINSCCSLS